MLCKTMTNPPIFYLLIFVICFQYSSVSSKFLSSLYKGSSLSVVQYNSDFLTSPDNSFTCGFYQVGIHAYCFSIWFTNSANKTVVWMANRDRPVNGYDSKISLHGDGTMVLSDVDGTVVWSTNTTNTDVNRAELLYTGNLVLKDTQGNILWQSFDSPTDTLLPKQLVTKNTKLVSAKGKRSYSTGHYSFFYDNDNTLKLLYDSPEISSLYWPDPDNTVFGNGKTSYNSSRIAVLNEMGRFVSSDKMEFAASDMGVGIKRRLTLDYDGNLRLYSLNESSGLWIVSWEALPQQCKVHGLCGRNGICVYSPKPTCSCPPGYEMSDQSDWNKGCMPKVNRKCNQKVKYVEIPFTDFYGYDFSSFTGMSFEDCRKICTGNCSCEAFLYRITGQGQCFLKSALLNGYKSPSSPGIIYIKLSQNAETLEPVILEESVPICNETKVQKVYSNVYSIGRVTKWAYMYIFISAIGMIEIFFLTSGWWFLYKRQGGPISVTDGYRALSNQFRKFTYAELKKATKNFKEELGRGGSGAVYKGILGDNRVVSVKKLISDVIQGDEEFWAEVSTIGRINHMNLVRMWGFCPERRHKLLVYEYLENGSLDKHLFSNIRGSSRSNNNSTTCRFLSWKERFKIAVGAAKGLAYLHHECLEWVIHCDVKPENILLDIDFEPKMADFGMSKLSQRGGSRSEFSRIRGTKGYMAPEWVLNVPITAKVDVYSFGIVLLEIAKGVRFSGWVVENEEEETELTRFLREMKKRIECGENCWIDHIIDPRLNGKFSRKQAAMMVHVGISCIEEDRIKRPTMDSVVQSLLHVEDDWEGQVDAEEML